MNLHYYLSDKPLSPNIQIVSAEELKQILHGDEAISIDSLKVDNQRRLNLYAEDEELSPPYKRFKANDYESNE